MIKHGPFHGFLGFSQVQIDSPSINSSMLSLSNVYFRSRKCAKKSIPNTNISVKKQGNLINESMPTTEDDYSPPDQPLSSSAFENVPAAIDNVFVSEVYSSRLLCISPHLRILKSTES